MMIRIGNIELHEPLTPQQKKMCVLYQYLEAVGSITFQDLKDINNSSDNDFISAMNFLIFMGANITVEYEEVIIEELGFYDYRPRIYRLERTGGEK